MSSDQNRHGLSFYGHHCLGNRQTLVEYSRECIYNENEDNFCCFCGLLEVLHLMGAQETASRLPAVAFLVPVACISGPRPHLTNPGGWECAPPGATLGCCCGRSCDVTCTSSVALRVVSHFSVCVCETGPALWVGVHVASM